VKRFQIEYQIPVDLWRACPSFWVHRSAALQVAHRLDDNYGFLHRKEMDLSIFIGKVFDEAMTINGYF